MQAIRGDNVNILFLPKLHYELDPSEYVAVILLNEISLKTEGATMVNVDDTIEIINRFPAEIWKVAVDQAKSCEEFYRNNGTKEETENEENNNKIKIKDEL